MQIDGHEEKNNTTMMKKKNNKKYSDLIKNNQVRMLWKNYI